VRKTTFELLFATHFCGEGQAPWEVPLRCDRVGTFHFPDGVSDEIGLKTGFLLTCSCSRNGVISVSGKSESADSMSIPVTLIRLERKIRRATLSLSNSAVDNRFSLRYFAP
jgi:hypothetical protein